MKKIIILLILNCSTVLAKEGYLDPFWFEGSGEKKSAESDQLESIAYFIETMTDSELEALNFPQEKSQPSSPWYFAGAQTAIAFGLSGKIGLLTFGGTKSLEVNWERSRPMESKTNQEESPADTLIVHSDTTKADLQQELEPFIRSLVDSHKVKDESVLRKELQDLSGNFLAYAKGMDAARITAQFVPVKIRLEINVEASGKVASAVPVINGKIAVPVKLRLEFIRLIKRGSLEKTNNLDLTETEKKIATQTKSLMEKLAEEVALAYSDEVREIDMQRRNLELKFLEVGLGIGIEGTVGLATLKANIVPSVFFGKMAGNTTGVRSLDKSLKGKIMVFMDSKEKGLRDQVLELQGRQVRKGMKKAIDFAYKFADKIQKKSENKKSNWKFKDLESRYHFSLAGTVGPVKLTGLPHFIIHIANTAK